MLQVLLKQQKDLDTEYWDVIQMRSTPVKKTAKRSSATVKKSAAVVATAAAQKIATFGVQSSTVANSPSRSGLMGTQSQNKFGINTGVNSAVGGGTPMTRASTTMKTNDKTRNHQANVLSDTSPIR